MPLPWPEVASTLEGRVSSSDAIKGHPLRNLRPEVRCLPPWCPTAQQWPCPPRNTCAVCRRLLRTGSIERGPLSLLPTGTGALLPHRDRRKEGHGLWGMSKPLEQAHLKQCGCPSQAPGLFAPLSPQVPPVGTSWPTCGWQASGGGWVRAQGRSSSKAL